MKKIFILTGEPSGDKLASKVVKELKKNNLEIDYLSVGGENLKGLGIKSIYDLKEITYMGFTNVISNIFEISIVSVLRDNKIGGLISLFLIFSNKILLLFSSLLLLSSKSFFILFNISPEP